MLITQGKTKKITQGPTPDSVLIETLDVLTGGDAAKRASIQGIGINKTRQAANVFTLLSRAGIPTSFIRLEDDTTMLCKKCDMLPLEIVVRRYAFGSYLIRQPEFKTDPPHRFDAPVYEFFHKHSLIAAPHTDKPYQMSEEEARTHFLKDGVWAEGVYTDPYIRIDGDKWWLHPQKKLLDPAAGVLAITPELTQDEVKAIVETIVLPVFLTLEKAWAKVETVHGPVALVDMKIELGRTMDGELVLSDVIDNDSWRIWPGADPKKQLDKQNFRDDHPLSEVADNYQLVANLTDQFLK